MLIEIEGPRGAGKSTLIENLCADLGNSEHPFIDAAVVEQRDTDPGWLVGALMRSFHQPLAAHEAVFLYCARTAARARTIRRLLAPGTIVLSDRLRLSLQVQVCLAGITADNARTLIRLAMHEIEPDYTVLLDVDYAGHYRRITEQGREPQAKSDFQETRAHFTHAYRHIMTPKLCLNTADMTAQEVQGAVLGGLALAQPAQ